MPCKGCGDETSDRYTSSSIGVAEGAQPPSQPSPEEPQASLEHMFVEVNKYSLDTLLKMRDDIRRDEEAKFKEILSYQSEDLIALKVITFVNIFNGTEFSQEGHSPEYCLEMLNAMLDFEGTANVFRRFDGLAIQIREKYSELLGNRIKLDLK